MILTPEDRALAAKFDGDSGECRMDSISRAARLSAARELNRSARLMSEHELLQALQNVLASYERNDSFSDRLLELCSDMDSYCVPDVEELDSRLGKGSYFATIGSGDR